MGLFSKKPNAKKLLSEALSLYKAGDYTASYDKVCEGAELGDARAIYCKALLMYNDNVAPDSTPDSKTLISLARQSLSGGYAPAYGLLAFILHATKDIDGLCELCRLKSKSRDGVYLSFKASYLFGLYTDEENADARTILTAARDAVSALRMLDDQIKSAKSEEALEYALYNSFEKYKLNYTYSHACYVLLTVIYCQNDWSLRREFMSTFEQIMTYMPIADEKYRAASLYMGAVLDNYLGMSDFSEANRAMGILNDCFKAMDEDDKERFADDYGELYTKYDSFYDEQKERMGNREVTYSDGYVGENALSASNIASAIVSGAEKWANSESSSSTVTTYTVNGKVYTRGEMGYLYDAEGFKTGYRVDDYSRLYGDGGTELGYFNTNGNFISN